MQSTERKHKTAHFLALEIEDVSGFILINNNNKKRGKASGLGHW